MIFRRRHNADASLLFDNLFYARYRGAYGIKGDPYTHYLRYGIDLGLDPNAYFDTKWYLDTYGDVRDKGVNPLDHYFRFGRVEGRNPSLRFSTLMYLAVYEDVRKQTDLNPLVHFLQSGVHEGRFAPPVIVLGDLQRLSGQDTQSHEMDFSLINAYARIVECKCHTVENYRLSTGALNSPEKTELGNPLDFIASPEVNEMVVHGIKHNALLLPEPKVSAETAPGYDERVGRDLSVRVWRYIYSAADRLSMQGTGTREITNNNSFSGDLLSRIYNDIPIHPAKKDRFTHLLHQDLLRFVSDCGGLRGSWGEIFCIDGKMILKAPPRAKRSMISKPKRERKVI